jgi:hypothetical protein
VTKSSEVGEIDEVLIVKQGDFILIHDAYSADYLVSVG